MIDISNEKKCFMGDMVLLEPLLNLCEKFEITDFTIGTVIHPNIKSSESWQANSLKLYGKITNYHFIYNETNKTKEAFVLWRALEKIGIKVQCGNYQQYQIGNNTMSICAYSFIDNKWIKLNIDENYVAHLPNK